jgi:hypothetical protein
MNDITVLQDTIAEMPQVTGELQHFFAHGVYARNIKLPKGTLAVGECHKESTLNVLLKGEIMVYMGEDQAPVHVVAPCVFVSEAWVKKVAYCVEDVELMNVHASHQTDLAALKAELIVPDGDYRAALQKAAQEVLE